MKIWVVVYRAGDDDRADAGVEDELFVDVYRRLEAAKKACIDHLAEEPEWESEEIEWGETTTKGDRNRRLVGVPQGNAEHTYELYQSDVV